MIKTSKLAVILQCCFIVGIGGLAWSHEAPQAVLLTIGMNKSLPSTAVLGNALESGFIVSMYASITDTLDEGTFSEVDSPIVQSVEIYMVSNFALRERQDHGMHPEFVFVINKPTSIKTFAVLVGSFSTPVPLRKPLEVTGVNDSVLAFSEWYQAVGLVRRLNNGVPWKRLSGHVLTSNENLVFSRHSSIYRRTIFPPQL